MDHLSGLRRLSVAAMAVFACSAVGAGDGGGPGPLVTDRPDFTESTPTLAPGYVQLESGMTFTSDSDKDRGEYAFPELLVRVGISPRLELRLTPPGYAADERAGASGFTDAMIGFKMGLAEETERSPAFSVIGGLSLPSGEDDFGASEPAPEVKLLWSMTLTDRLSVAGNLNLSVPDGDGVGRFVEPSASVSLGIGLLENVGMYLEYFGFYPVGAPDGEGVSTHYLNTGITYLLSDSVQLDARVGVGLNEHSDDVFAGVGVCVRF